MKTLKIIIGVIISVGFINMLIKFFDHLKASQSDEIPSDIVALIILGVTSIALFYFAFSVKKNNNSQMVSINSATTKKAATPAKTITKEATTPKVAEAKTTKPAVKKTAKSATTKKTATPAKTATKKAASPKAAAVKTTKPAVKKTVKAKASSAKKTVVSKVKDIDVAIRRKATEIYNARIAKGEHGTLENDWLKAEKEVKAKKK
jgi:hypothetical protein